MAGLRKELGAHEMVPNPEEASHGVDQGLHLVHSLLACTMAVGCHDLHLATCKCSRVSFCFVTGLKSRLLLLQNVNRNGTIGNTQSRA
ncbi:hypothetical protein GQ457_01G008070 [Hibiscus cannabinus]